MASVDPRRQHGHLQNDGVLSDMGLGVGLDPRNAKDGEPAPRRIGRYYLALRSGSHEQHAYCARRR